MDMRAIGSTGAYYTTTSVTSHLRDRSLLSPIQTRCTRHPAKSVLLQILKDTPTSRLHSITRHASQEAAGELKLESETRSHYPTSTTTTRNGQSYADLERMGATSHSRTG